MDTTPLYQSYSRPNLKVGHKPKTYATVDDEPDATVFVGILNVVRWISVTEPLVVKRQRILSLHVRRGG